MRITLHPGPVAGPNVVVPTPEELVAALEGFDHHAPWAEIAPRIIPVFERRRPQPPGSPPPVTVVLPPGVSVGFGVDLGPAFIRVAEPLLADWGIERQELAAIALGNIRERAARPGLPDPYRGELAGLPSIWFQSDDGWASALLLVPDALTRVLGPEDRLYVAPMRDLLIGLPIDAHLGLARWIAEEVEAADPNGLALEAFAFEGGRLSCRPMREALSA